MRYETIVTGTFIDRPNRFIANVMIDGRAEVCHVKNTGRCRELLTPGAEVYLEVASNPDRKTKYDLVGVKKGNLMINMDSQAPNVAVGEWLRAGNLFPDAVLIKPEKKFGNSRFDFYVETPERKIFMEVKGVTLEEDGVVRFPDAPTERGIKHMEELIASMAEGYEAYILFVIQMKNVKYFEPNDKTHKAFGDVLRKAAKTGVKVLAYDCTVTETEMWLDQPVSVRL